MHAAGARARARPRPAGRIRGQKAILRGHLRTPASVLSRPGRELRSTWRNEVPLFYIHTCRGRGPKSELPTIHATAFDLKSDTLHSRRGTTNGGGEGGEIPSPSLNAKKRARSPNFSPAANGVPQKEAKRKPQEYIFF